jgi:hypothetical protein
LNKFYQPIPIDSINKYWGVDAVFSKHDETLQKQSYDQSHKNFWSFVDFNLVGDMYMNNISENVSGASGSLSLNNILNNHTINSHTKSFSGSGSSSVFRSSGNGIQNSLNKITGLSYQEAKMKSTK